jgi:membrane protease YdiL (CAAX protease family)
VYCQLVRNVAAMLILLVAVFAGAALLAPLAWMAVAPGEPELGLGFLKFLKAHDDFHRYFTRLLLFLALLGLAIHCKLSGIKTWAEVGWTRFPGNGRRLSSGILLGLASLTAIAALAAISGVRDFSPNHSLAEWANHLVNALGAALIVAILEETLFRGMFFGLLRRDLVWRWAALASSCIYASVHFLNQQPNIETVTWTTGFTTFPEFLPDFANDPFWPTHFLNLVLSGLILAGAYERTGNLYFSIGIHAGWIFCIKTIDFVTQSALAEPSPFWGQARLMDGLGWVATPLLGLMVWFIFRGSGPEPKKPSP